MLLFCKDKKVARFCLLLLLFCAFSLLSKVFHEMSAENKFKLHFSVGGVEFVKKNLLK